MLKIKTNFMVALEKQWMDSAEVETIDFYVFPAISGDSGRAV